MIKVNEIKTIKQTFLIWSSAWLLTFMIEVSIPSLRETLREQKATLEAAGEIREICFPRFDSEVLRTISPTP